MARVANVTNFSRHVSRVRVLSALLTLKGTDAAVWRFQEAVYCGSVSQVDACAELAVFEFGKEEQMNPLLAYFDPSAGSLLLQALVGGFGGLVVLGRYLWLQLFGNKRTAPRSLCPPELESPH
jgi:hypothetical protein